MTGLPGILDCYTLNLSGLSCYLNGSCSDSCITFGYLSFLIISLPSYTIPAILYGVLYCKARKSQAKTNLDENETRASSRRANITFFLLFLSCFVLTVPNTTTFIVVRIISLFYGFSSGLRLSLFIIYHISISLVILDALVILRNRDIKEVFTTFCCSKKGTIRREQ